MNGGCLSKISYFSAILEALLPELPKLLMSTICCIYSEDSDARKLIQVRFPDRRFCFLRASSFKLFMQLIENTFGVVMAPKRIVSQDYRFAHDPGFGLGDFILLLGVIQALRGRYPGINYLALLAK